MLGEVSTHFGLVVDAKAASQAHQSVVFVDPVELLPGASAVLLRRVSLVTGRQFELSRTDHLPLGHSHSPVKHHLCLSLTNVPCFAFPEHSFSLAFKNNTALKSVFLRNLSFHPP